MKKYYNPEMIVEIIDNEDILTASIGDNVSRYGFEAFEEQQA